MPKETLKRGHTLRGEKLTPLIRTIRQSTANPTDLARIDPSRPTEDMSLEEMEDIFSTLTGETMEDILDMARREVNIYNAQLLIHHTVVYANDVGQPSEQDLDDTLFTPQVHGAVLTPKQVPSPTSQPCSSSSRPVAAPAASSSTSRSAPTPDRSAATRPVVAPAASSSTSRSAPTPDPSAATRPVAALAASSTSSSAPSPDPSTATRPVAALAASSTSSSAPTPDPSAAIRPVAAPAASSSSSSQGHAAEVLGEPEAPRQPPFTGDPQRALKRKASDINPETNIGNTEEPSTSETPIKRQRLDDNTLEKLLERIKVLEGAVSLLTSHLNLDHDDQVEQTIYKPLVHEAASAPKQVVSPCSLSFSSSSSSAPIPDPSAATRPVAASSSTSSPAHAAEGLGEPESHRQLPSTSTGGPQNALTRKASNINPEVSKALLQNNRMVLVKNGDFSHIKDQLMQDRILTQAEMETVELPVLPRGGKMSKLFDILLSKPDNHVVRFFESLEKADRVLYSQLDMSHPGKTRRDDCSSSGKTDHLSIIKEELKDWYKESMAKIKPMPWCKWLEQDLDHVYTNVRVVEGKKHRISHSLPGVTQSTDETDTSSLLERVFSPTDERTICFVQGVAGVGKSIFCRRSVYLWSKGEGLDFDLVFLLTANLLKGVLKTDIREQLFPDDFILSADDVYTCLQENQTKALLVIDGLDEINTNSKGMACVMQLIQGKILRKVNMLLTGRPEVSMKFVEYARVHLEIRGFTYANVETYISKYFSNDPNRERSLLQLLKSDDNLVDLSRTPFTTLLLCMLADETHGDIPDKIDEIYRQVISLVFRKYVRKLTDNAQGSAHSTSTEEVPGAAETSEAAEITETQLLQGAASLAYKLQRMHKQNCQEKEVPLICNKADHLLKSGILNRDYTLSRMHDASAYCYFPHLSIQEYLCAWYLNTSTDELADNINVNIILSEEMIRVFYISIFVRDAQTALNNVGIAWNVLNNTNPWYVDERRVLEFYLAEALWERNPNKATKEFLVERIFGTFEDALCCLVDIQERKFEQSVQVTAGYLQLMKELLTDGPLSQRSHKYDWDISEPDTPVVFQTQRCVHYSYISDPSVAGDYHDDRLSFATAITLLPNNVDRLKIEGLVDWVCKENIFIVLVFENLHDDSSQKNILFELDRLWFRYRFYRKKYRKLYLRPDRTERPYLQIERIHVIRLRPTIRVEAGDHPETELSRMVAVDCRLKTPFYKMYYDRFCPY